MNLICNKHRSLLKTFVLIIFLLNNSCAFYLPVNQKKVEVDAPDLSRLSGENCNIDHFIYTPRKYPLEDIFVKMAKGDFKEAFRKAEFSYHPSSTDNEALKAAIDGGYIPVFVRIENTGNSELIFDEKSFELIDGDEKIKAFYSQHLPARFHKVDLETAALNLAYIPVLVSIVALIVVTVGPVLQHFPAISPPESSDPKKATEVGSESSNKILSEGNSQESVDSSGEKQAFYETVTKVDYNKYLIAATHLAPKKSVSGILLFQTNKHDKYFGYRLNFLPDSAGSSNH